MKWKYKCKRCKAEFIKNPNDNSHCNCKTSPSPWEQVIPWWRKIINKMGL